MKKLTELLGKPVLSLYESVTQGIVKDALFDKNFKRLKYLVIFNDNEFQEEKLISISEIYSNGKNAIIIKNDACIDGTAKIVDEIGNPINNLVYTTLGSLLGTATDIVFDDKYYIKKVILSNNMEIDIDRVVTSGKDAMFVQDENNIVKLCSFKKKSVANSASNNRIKVEILNRNNSSKKLDNPLITPENDTQKTIDNYNSLTSEQPTNSASIKQPATDNTDNIIDTNSQLNQQDNNSALPVDQTQKVEPIKPKKKVILQDDCLPKTVASKNNFLIGRKVTKNIYSFNHELIIKKNTRVTEKTIVIAKSHSKIKELALYSI